MGSASALQSAGAPGTHATVALYASRVRVSSGRARVISGAVGPVDPYGDAAHPRPDGLQGAVHPSRRRPVRS
ncbi:hypothetical protein [Streptomyces sp. NPDC001389]|uniref:hypothetical protein n=1 Tax=unclassified Streptomyces TaxID=2593676 RepID=UPI0036AB9801